MTRCNCSYSDSTRRLSSSAQPRRCVEICLAIGYNSFYLSLVTNQWAGLRHDKIYRVCNWPFTKPCSPLRYCSYACQSFCSCTGHVQCTTIMVADLPLENLIINTKGPWFQTEVDKSRFLNLSWRPLILQTEMTLSQACFDVKDS